MRPYVDVIPRRKAVVAVVIALPGYAELSAIQLGPEAQPLL